MSARASWTQPLCVSCWNRRNPSKRVTDRRSDGPIEACCDCGEKTRSGIYMRLDPTLIRYPTVERAT